MLYYLAPSSRSLKVQKKYNSPGFTQGKTAEKEQKHLPSISHAVTLSQEPAPSPAAFQGNFPQTTNFYLAKIKVWGQLSISRFG